MTTFIENQNGRSGLKDAETFTLVTFQVQREQCVILDLKCGKISSQIQDGTTTQISSLNLTFQTIT